MTKRRILVVDDEKNIRLMLPQALADEETKIDTAVNGEEALDKLGQAAYDLVLLDLRLPGMDGLEVLKEIHKRDAKLPVILLTAHGTVENAVEAMKIGAANFLQKPFSPRELREAVENVLTPPVEEEHTSDEPNSDP